MNGIAGNSGLPPKQGAVIPGYPALGRQGRCTRPCVPRTGPRPPASAFSIAMAAVDLEVNWVFARLVLAVKGGLGQKSRVGRGAQSRIVARVASRESRPRESARLG